tara:strand:+ start:4264 stop:4830 length:567 start_codon:yes stop_codon:yes gene_type:complete
MNTNVLGAIVAILCFTQACVKAPNVSIVDSNTALESQAAGEYHALENDLQQAGISPRSEPIPRESLISRGNSEGAASRGEVALLFIKVERDAARVDALLSDQCIGEALDGLLKPTTARCKANIDTTEMTQLIGRENLHRRQIWQLIMKERSENSMQKVQTSWRQIHLERVVCGGLVETRNNVWEPKEC